jgi:predicted  nucleic acid-binding Zn-ribbon protein
MQGSKPFTIGFVTDPCLSREKTQIALRALNSLRNFAEIRYYPGTLSEDDLVDRLKRETLDLLMVPWHAYLHYQKIEAQFGLTRTHGPTMVGYFAEDVSPFEIQEEDHHFRAILVDLNRLATTEASTVLRSLLRDSTRWGLRPLMTSGTALHFESWTAQVGMGFRIDTVLNLNEIANSHWVKRANAVRVLISALWSLIFDNGPGKADRARSGADRTSRAYFEIGVDAHCLGFRLCYSEPGWKVKDVLHQFWPGALTPSAAGQILFQYSDLLRVHVDPDSSEIEIVCALFPSGPSERATDILHTLWIEPISNMTRLERFSESPETEEHFHKPLVTHHALIGNAAEKIEELKKQVEAKDKEIDDLRSKGTTRENVFIYPSGLDGEQLIDLVNRRLAEIKAKIKSANSQFQALRQDRDEELKEAGRLMKELRELQAQQKGWIARLTEIVDGYHQQFAAAAQERTAALAVDEKVEDLNEEETALAAAGTQTREVKTRKTTRKKAA